MLFDEEDSGHLLAYLVEKLEPLCAHAHRVRSFARSREPARSCSPPPAPVAAARCAPPRHHNLPRRCDADPSHLAAYVLELLRADKTSDELHAQCLSELDAFLKDGACAASARDHSIAQHSTASWGWLKAAVG